MSTLAIASPGLPLAMEESAVHLDLGAAASHASIVNIQGLHFAHSAHATLKASPVKLALRENRTSAAEDTSSVGTASTESSPTLGPVSSASNSEEETSQDSGSVNESTEVEVDKELARMVVDGLTKKRTEVNLNGKTITPLSLPTILLYDKRGLEIYEEITYLEEYYLFNAELEILKNQGGEIIDMVLGGLGEKEGVAMIELGCGSMRKTRHLLHYLSAHPNASKCTYFAVDLDYDTLAATVSEMESSFPMLNFVGLNGTYDDALQFVKNGGLDAPGTNGLKEAAAGTSEDVRRKRCLFWFGSSIGNFERGDASVFVEKWTAETLQEGDAFVVGIDRRNAKDKIELAYNDPKQVTARFCLNGLVHADRLLRHLCPTEEPIINPADFSYFTQYDVQKGRHEAFFKVSKQGGVTINIPAELVKELWTADAPEDPVRTHTSDDFAGGLSIHLAENDLVHIEYSYKYSPEEVAQLVHHASLAHTHKWADPLDQFDLHFFTRPPVFMPREPTTLGNSVPSQAEWTEIWKAWELVTEKMIPADRVLERPIALRHPFVFYLGHIPSFEDIMVNKALQWGLTEPKGYADIFERGIDPDMEDPTKCHAHSLVPDVWPSRSEILEFKERVKARVAELCVAYEKSVAEGVDEVDGIKMSKDLARALWMAYEHQAMHLETILYMVVQSPNFAPQTDVIPAPRASASELILPAPSAMVTLPSGTFERGIPFTKDPKEGLFGWDNESPPRTATVSSFKMQERPVTNIEFLAFLDAKLAKGWQTASELDELVPSSWFLDSNGDIFIKTALGRIPLLVGQHWPVFISGAQAEAYAAAKGMRLPTEDELAWALECEGKQTSAGMSQANVGFAKWHPDNVVADATDGAEAQRLKHVLGHGWEWSSTEFAPFPGFEADPNYLGYSADFFDGKHNAILGGSWATVPMIAGRKSFRNWYQTPYPFVFAKFRLCSSV